MDSQKKQSTTYAPRLKAGSAFAILGLYILAQFITGVVVSFTTVIVAVFQGTNIQDPQALAPITQHATALSAILGFLVASIIVLPLSIRRFPDEIEERSPTGAAWVTGTSRFIGLGLGVGALIAIACLVFSPLMSVPPDKNSVGPIAKMASTPGFQRFIVSLIALLLAPPVEELLFRGVLFGGISRSLGTTWSAILTTTIFTVFHITEAIHFWPAFVFIALMASAALWFRIQTRSIGPSIALHFSYNFILIGTTFLAS